MRAVPQWTEFRRYPVVSATLLLAIIASVRFWSGGSIDLLVENADIGRGQVWRLVTSALPHVNLMHLAFNLYWLWGLGTIVEGAFGHWRTAALLILLAAGSGAADYAIMDGGIGLSGVGYGLFGLLWILHRRGDARFADAMDSRTVGLFAIWFFVCIALTAAQVMRVGNIAHGAGAVLGVLLGYAIALPSRRREATATLLLVVLVSIAGALWLRPWINLSPRAGDDEARRGYDALMANDDDESLRWCRQAVRLAPHRSDNWINLGIAMERAGQPAESAKAYERARELDPATTQP